MTNKETFEERIIDKFFSGLDKNLTEWMAKYGLQILRISLGIVFLWFGLLKFFKGMSPAEELVRNTVYFIDPDLFIPILACWESLIGIGLITGKFLRFTILLLFLQMPGTALPLLILPEKVWTHFPFALTLEGQYIVKNLVLIGAALVIGATVRGGKILTETGNKLT